MVDEPMTETGGKPKVRRGLLIAGLVLVVLALGIMAHFTISAGRAGFPVEMIARGRNWLFIGGHAFAGLVGLILLGLSRPRFKPGKFQTIEAVASTRVVSKVSHEPEPEPESEGPDLDDGPVSLREGASQDSPNSKSDAEPDDEV